MTEPAQSYNADLLARADFPVAQRRIGSDAGTEQRRHPGKRQVLGDAQHESFIDHDILRVAAVGDAAVYRVFAVVGADEADFAILLVARPAACAGTAGIDQTADAGKLADVKVLYLVAHRAHAPHDLVAGHAGIDSVFPFVTRGMEIGMADAAKEDVDLDIVRARFAPIKREGRERRAFGTSRICIYFAHFFTIKAISTGLDRLVERTSTGI
jgi:hypothetical protein